MSLMKLSNRLRGRGILFAALFIACAPAAAKNSPRAIGTAYIDVSVATLWTSPDSPRPIDHPALTNPVHMQKWIDGMSVAQRRWLSGHNATQTQALYGHKVYILKEQGQWDKIAVPGQPTPKNPLGYPGWVPKVQLTHSSHFGEIVKKHPFALVSGAPTVWLYNNEKLSHKFLRISFNTRLPVLSRTADAVRVATPDDGPKWLKASDVKIYKSTADIPRPTPAELLKTAKQFVGLPYIWAGRSGFAYDCSGFTGSMYQYYGMTLPRDAGAQALHGHGKKIPRTNHDLQRGDLLFYANHDGTGSIYHVAMYVGNGKMIEAYASGTPLRVTTARFGKNYWGAAKFLKEGANAKVANSTKTATR